MEFTLTQDFLAGLDCLWAAFGRADYPRLKYVALGATAVRLHRFNATAQVIDIELERVCVFRRSVTDRFGSVTAELDIWPTGLPVRARGTAAIVESGPESTRLLLTWRVQSGVPVIGDKVERLFADQVRNALEADNAFTLQYLMAIAARTARCAGRR